jgi:phage-related baseplate assembly protein
MKEIISDGNLEELVHRTWLSTEVDKLRAAAAEFLAKLSPLTATGEDLDRLSSFPRFERMTLPEGHPDAIEDPFFGGWRESDDAFRKRIMAAGGRNKV